MDSKKSHFDKESAIFIYLFPTYFSYFLNLIKVC
jgi:hypothetical protein